jgi:flavin-dependent dehydrogenase
MHDVIIVGAGPAGAVAALVLARAGLRVRVFERARFPRDKLCGDTLNPGALAIMRRLGLDHVAGGGLPIDGMIVTGAGGVQVRAAYERAQGRALVRRDLDTALARAAAAAGAAIEEGVLVRGALATDVGRRRAVTGVVLKGSDGRPVRETARLVIAADGGSSRVARGLGLSRFPRRPRRWAVGGYFDRVGAMSSYGEMHVRPGHYIGVAPLAGGVANACVVTADRARLRDPAALLTTTLGSDPQLAGRFARARLIARPVCTGPLAVDCDRAGASGLLLAGDAAGFIDPMTGDGVRLALRGGELAATAALEALARGGHDAHLRLRDARRREFAWKWRFNRALRAMVSASGAVWLAERGAAAAPDVLRRVIRYAGDVGK